MEKASPYMHCCYLCQPGLACTCGQVHALPLDVFGSTIEQAAYAHGSQLRKWELSDDAWSCSVPATAWAPLQGMAVSRGFFVSFEVFRTQTRTFKPTLISMHLLGSSQLRCSFAHFVYIPKFTSKKLYLAFHQPLQHPYLSPFSFYCCFVPSLFPLKK